jgi:hypothetical protein
LARLSKDKLKLFQLYVDAWFDVMNSHQKCHLKPNKCGLGIHEREQTEALKNMLDLVQHMSFGKDEAAVRKKPFQTGIVVSINSTLDLFEELKTEGVSYLLTSRLNQDALENLFSQIRALGGQNTHPSSVDTINRIRTICLCKNAHSIVSDYCPVECDSKDEDLFLSVNLVEQVVPDFSECETFISDEFIDDVEIDNNEPRNYVAGYIANKLCLHKGTVASNFLVLRIFLWD